MKCIMTGEHVDYAADTDATFNGPAFNSNDCRADLDYENGETKHMGYSYNDSQHRETPAHRGPDPVEHDMIYATGVGWVYDDEPPC